ncbi:amidohydrolase family protein [Acinetobacter sp. WC-323]|uniref:amidohydrolase n=1 Tax=Acinetobacter sp. WC-323 TaxID=903918 RepID=UPI00029EA8D0|nr:amidohydrolase [Acinetobacter sp. WC-323]EKU56569.1 amidohydrolase family protein [Acinetobacter sp. WC-323]
MKKKLLLGLAVGIISLAGHAQIPQVDVIVINADIRTSNPAKPKAQAFAVQNGKFLAVGDNQFIQKMATKQTQIIDAKGKTVLPGLTDAHTHLLGGLELWEGVDLFGITDRQEWFKLIAKRDQELPKGAWLVGGRWDLTSLKDNRMPTRQELDAIVPDRPVVLQDIDYHTVWVNTKAMQLLGIDKHSKSPEGGEIVKDPKTGEPTGIFKETAGTQLILGSPQYSGALLSGKAALPTVERIIAHFNSLGITSVHDMWTELATVYPALLDSKQQLPMRIRFGLMTGEDHTSPAQFKIYAQQRDELNQRFMQKEREWQQGPQFRFGYIKYIIDGTLMNYTAALNEPYADRHHFNIEPMTSQENLNNSVKNANDAGFPVAVHAIGDKSVDMALNAIEKSPKHQQFINRIEHIEVLSKDDIPRFAQLGVVASMQPDHAISGNYQESRLGEARMPYSYAWQSLLSSGATMVLGSDWPTAPENPMLQLSDVVFREYQGKTRYSNNALSLDEALYAYTQAPANIAGWGDQLGSISVGKWADFVVLQDTLKTPLNKDIKNWKVDETWFAGRQVYNRKTTEK